MFVVLLLLGEAHVLIHATLDIYCPAGNHLLGNAFKRGIRGSKFEGRGAIVESDGHRRATHCWEQAPFKRRILKCHPHGFIPLSVQAKQDLFAINIRSHSHHITSAPLCSKGFMIASRPLQTPPSINRPAMLIIPNTFLIKLSGFFNHPMYSALIPVSYTPLTLPTLLRV
eukprot:NODE_3364_length_565_cov_58.974806_g2838_i0.p1 GENE.NODE_3364_length_565_cov_58.974806_g2838_i0~~NODE_3364_length_565_cov_58.974806_g2838_i0.p1  ORF type:complete len:170 (-),score=25.69 NODE_3364_length_565_cov_58.974806_g2838_i0:21-530(-)